MSDPSEWEPGWFAVNDGGRVERLAERGNGGWRMVSGFFVNDDFLREHYRLLDAAAVAALFGGPPLPDDNLDALIADLAELGDQGCKCGACEWQRIVGQRAIERLRGAALPPDGVS